MENYTGELIALGVAVSWTITALCFEYAGKKIGALALNVVRLTLAILMLGIMLQYFTGSIAPWNAGWEAWGWLTLSGLVGYVFGDFCLFNSYLIIGARFGQLFMTLAPLFAAITGYLFLGENMNLSALLGMLICITGIGLSIIGQTDSAKEKNGNSHKWEITLPTKGILLGIGAALGQGVGLVLSKMGINSYLTHVPPVTPTETFMVPFAATQVRAIVGLIGFLILLFIQGRQHALLGIFRDRRVLATSTAGTFFGPFVGVAFSLMAVQYTGAGIASTLMALTPVLIILPSHYIFKERITFRQILGTLISIIGVSLFFL